MKIEIFFFIYAIIFRISVLIAGIISIIIGYKLFLKGLYSEHISNNANLDASIGEWKITLKNAGPGTFFALFGLIIIHSMIQNGNPELVIEKYSNKEKLFQPSEVVKADVAKSTTTQDKSSTNNIIHKSSYRNIDEECQYCNILDSVTHYRNQNDENLIKTYKNALELTCVPLNELAWLWFKNDNNLEDALILTESAIIFNPKDATYWDTKAEILFKLKRYQKAYDAIEQASKLDSSNYYYKKMQNFKKKLK